MPAPSKRVFVLAGERSGDVHGAALIRDLRAIAPAVEVRGLGGPLMRAEAGEGMHDWVEEAGVLGLWEVLKKYGWFHRKMEETVALLARWQPDVVVFIDYPGFNLRLADRLQPMRPRVKLLYYVSPQVWAWNRARIPRMAAMLDRMLCIFPFEKSLYEESGLPTDFIGHPLVDEFAPLLAKPVARQPDLVGLFPGSRRREIEKHFPILLEAARALSSARPGLRFIASAASASVASSMHRMIASAGLDALVSLQTGDSRTIMRQCTVAAVASGTATLEAAFLGLPYCLVYKVARPTYLVGRALVRVPHLGIVNLLAGRGIVPEFIQDELQAARLAEWFQSMLDDPARCLAMQEAFRQVISGLGGPGAHHRAAAAVARLL